jgi:hypothetical protein
LKPKNIPKKTTYASNYNIKNQYDDTSERISFSTNRLNVQQNPIPNLNHFDDNSILKKLHLIKVDETRASPEGTTKRRMKGSRRLTCNFGIKWQLLNIDQNYNSNLPMISNTRSNISNDIPQIEQAKNDFMSKNRRTFNQPLINEQ